MAFRAEMAKNTLQLAIDGYKNNVRIAAQIDDKAQKAATVAGLFLAAAFGFLKPDTVDILLTRLGLYAVVMFIVTIGVFLLCLATCLAVMWLRGMPEPLSPLLVMTMNDDLMELPDEALTQTTKANYYRDQVWLWSSIISGQISINRDKARRLLFAQILLGGGMLCVSALFALAVLA